MPLGTTKKDTKAVMSFSESLARKVADEAKKEQDARMAHARERRAEMRDAFAAQRETKAHAMSEMARRHGDDISRFQQLKQDDTRLRQQEEDKKRARLQRQEQADREAARKGAMQLEATLRRLGVDGGEPARLAPTVRTTIAGQPADASLTRAPRDLHGHVDTDADRRRERDQQNAAVLAKIRARRVEDTEARRDKEKRQWRMEGELAAAATDVAARNEKTAWLERALEVAPGERQRAFQHLTATVAAAAEAKRTERVNEGLRAVQMRRAADADAKFAIAAKDMKVAADEAYEAEKAAAMPAMAAKREAKARDVHAYCGTFANALVDLCLDVVGINEAKVRAGTAATVQEPISTTVWRGLIEDRLGGIAASATLAANGGPRPASSNANASRLGGTSMLRQGTMRTSRTLTPASPARVQSPQQNAVSNLSVGSAFIESAANVNHDGNQAADVMSGFVRDVANLDAKALRGDLAAIIAADAKTRAAEARAAQQADLAAQPLAACILVGTVAARAAPVFDAMLSDTSAEGEARLNRLPWRLATKRSIESSLEAARERAAAEAAAAAEATKSVKGGAATSKGASKKASAVASEAPVVDASAAAEGTNSAPAPVIPETPGASLVVDIAAVLQSQNASTPLPGDDGETAAATPSATPRPQSREETTTVPADTRPLLVAGFADEELAEAFDGCGSGMFNAIAVATVQVPKITLAQAALAAVANRRQLDPAAIYRTVARTLEADAVAGMAIIESATGGTAASGHRRGAGRIVLDASSSETVPFVADSDAAAAVLDFFDSANVETVGLTLRPVVDAVTAEEATRARLEEADAALTMPDDLVQACFLELRSIEVEAASVVRSAATAVIGILRASDLPPQPPASAPADAQHNFWVAGDKVRTAATANVSEVVGECRAAAIELTASRLSTCCSILSAVAEGLFGPSLSSVPVPSDDQCKAHLAAQLGEFVLLPSDTAGAYQRQRGAVVAMLEEFTAAVGRSVSHEEDEVATNAAALRRGVLWPRLAAAVSRLAVAHYDAVAWWHAELATSAAVWLQVRLVAAGARCPETVAEFFDAGRVHRLEAPSFDPAEVKARPGGVSAMVADLVPTADAIADANLTPFAATHLRRHGAIANGNVAHMLASAQVATVSAASMAPAGTKCEGDTLFLPAARWFFREAPSCPAAPPSAAAGPTPDPVSRRESQIPPPASSDGKSPTPPVAEAPRSTSRPQSRSRSKSVTKAGKRGGSAKASRTPTPAVDAALVPLGGSKQPSRTPTPAVVIDETATEAEAFPERTLTCSDIGLLAPDDIAACLSDLAWPACADPKVFTATLALGRWHRRGETPARPIAAVTPTVLRAVGAMLASNCFPTGTARAPEAVAALVEHGAFGYGLFRALPVWKGTADLQLRALWRALSDDKVDANATEDDEAATERAASVQVRSLLRFLVGDAKSTARTLEGVYAACAALEDASMGTPTSPKPDALTWPVFEAVLGRGVDAEDIVAASLFSTSPGTSAAAAAPSVSLKGALVSPWGRATLIAATEAGLQLPALGLVQWP